MNKGCRSRPRNPACIFVAVVCCASTTPLATAHPQEPGDVSRAIVAEMIAYAESRSMPLSDAQSSGHDGKFRIRDANGNFSLNVGALMQTRYVLNLRDDNAQHDAIEPGFSARRTKLIFGGHIFSPEISFNLLVAHSRSSGALRLEYAFTNLELDDHRTLTLGQGKLRFLREESISSSRQLTADRSLTNEVFTQGFSQFIELLHTEDNWRASIALSDGLKSYRTDFDEPQSPSSFAGAASGGEADLAITARFETKTGDTWSRFKDFTSFPDQSFASLFGAALHYESGDASTTTFFRSYSLLAWTADYSLEGNGWNAYAAVIGAHARDGSLPANTDDYAALIQGAFFLPDADTELFARYDIMFPDTSRASSDPFDTLTFGFNHYLHAHAAKLTADIQWFLGDANALTGPRSNIGYLSSDDPNELVLRLQFQLLF